MTDLGQLKFFVAEKHPCSYLPRDDAATLFLDPNQKLDQTTYTALSKIGFRRSGNFVYRPHCAECTACIPVRIPVKDFIVNKKQKRILKKNQDLVMDIQEAGFSEIHYELYATYIRTRHADGDMFPPSKDQYEQFLISKWSNTQFIELKLAEKPVAIGVMDKLKDGLSAVYNFFDPSLKSRSLGAFTLLQQIQHTKEMGLEHLYLGYWVKACNKMNYKANYRPLEYLVNNHWIEFGPDMDDQQSRPPQERQHLEKV